MSDAAPSRDRMPALVGPVLAVALVMVLAGGGFLVGRQSAPASTGRTAVSSAASVGAAAPATPSASDVGFAQDMAAHHEQAVTMAELAQTRATGAVRALAFSILTLQSQELGLLRGWLRLWGAPGVDATPMTWMGMTGVSSATMPGMAPTSALRRLYALHGRAFDVLFLQLMIRHHEGGVLMAHAALQRTRLPAVHAAAQSITAEQVDDLATMRAMLRSDGARPLPAPS